MPLFLNPGENVRRYVWRGPECLYRNENGERVVVDVMGSGRFRIEGEATILVDEAPFAGKEGVFRESLFATAKDGLDVVADVGLGRDVAPNGEFVQVAACRLAGPGWVISCKGSVMMDGRVFAQISPDFPVPVLAECELGGPASWLAAEPLETQLLSRFSCDDLDEQKRLGFAIQNVSRAQTLVSRFDDGTELEGPVVSHLNAASWRIEVPKSTEWLLIRKRYDRFHGRQLARVLIDGVTRGYWYEPDQNRQNRWAWAKFALSTERFAGRTVTISIDPPPGTPLWSYSVVEVLGVSKKDEV